MSETRKVQAEALRQAALAADSSRLAMQDPGGWLRQRARQIEAVSVGDGYRPWCSTCDTWLSDGLVSEKAARDLVAQHPDGHYFDVQVVDADRGDVTG